MTDIRYSGISLAALIQIKKSIMTSRGTELLILTKDVQGVRVGATVKKTGRNGLKTDEWFVQVPLQKRKLVVKESDVIQKANWTMEDVHQFVVLPKTCERYCAYVDCVGQAAVGKPFQGTFVSCERNASFFNVVNGLEKLYHGQNPHEIFFWIDIFCTASNQYLNTEQDRVCQKQKLCTLAGKFKNHMIVYTIDEEAFCLQLLVVTTGQAIQTSTNFLWDQGDLVRDLFLQISRNAARAIGVLKERLRHASQSVPSSWSGFNYEAIAVKSVWSWLVNTAQTHLANQPTAFRKKCFADLLSEAARDLEGFGEIDTALYYYRQAKDLYVTMDETQADAAKVLMCIGKILSTMNKYDEALTDFIAAYHICHNMGDTKKMGMACFNLGCTYYSLLNYEKGLPLYISALETFKATFGVSHPRTAQLHHYIGVGYQKLLNDECALKNYEEALQIWRQTPGRHHAAATAATLEGMGDVYSHQGEYQKALEKYREALTLKREANSELHPETAQLLHRIGVIFAKLKNYQEALDKFYEALAMRKLTLGERHAATAGTLFNIGNVFHRQKKYDLALDKFSEALCIRKQTLGGGHPETATTFQHLGNVYMDLEKYEAALKAYKEALAIRRHTLGPDTATTLHSIGDIFTHLKKFESARISFSEALDIRKQVLEKLHPDTATTLNNLGNVLAHLKEYEQALEVYRDALEIKKQTLGERHPVTATTLFNMGIALVRMEKYEEAREKYMEALNIRKQALGERHPATASTLYSLGFVYSRQEKYELALGVYREALGIWKEMSGKQDAIADTATMLQSMGDVLKHLGKCESALETYREALEIRRQTLGETHPDTATTYDSMGCTLFQQGDLQGAMESLKKALEIRRKHSGVQHAHTAETYHNLGCVYDARGNPNEALKMWEKALEIRWRTPGKYHEDTANTCHEIASTYDKMGKYQEAREKYMEALEIEKNLDRHLETVQTYHNIAYSYLGEKNFAKAHEMIDLALDVSRRILGELSRETAILFKSKGVFFKRQGKHKRALRMFKKSLKILQDTGNQNGPTVQALQRLVRQAEDQRQASEKCRTKRVSTDENDRENVKKRKI